MSNLTFLAYPDPFVWWHVVLYLLAVGWGSFIIGCFGTGGGAVFAPILLLLPGMNPRVVVGTVFMGLFPSCIFRMMQLHRYGMINLPAAAPLMLGAGLGALAGQAALKFVPPVAAAFLVSFVGIWAGVQIQRKMMKERRLQKAAEKAEAGPPGAPVPAPGCAEAPTNSNKDNADLEDASAEANKHDDNNQKHHDSTASSDDVSAVALEEGQQQSQATSSSEGTSEESSAEESTPAKEGVDFLKDSKTDEKRKEAIMKVVIGFVASLLSSLSGTGGPLILFPMYLMWKPNINMKLLVGESGPFAFVTVGFSAAGACIFGEVDFGLALLFCLVGIIFTLLGGMMMKRMGESQLKLAIGFILIAVGSMVAVRTGLTLA
mmetsp:Transcript_63162/g.133323  ORF Transcript_63162/g.133323 Transcript_63162/m.133323 type:complete len:375 (+) Transcript_63162:124-1248(+)|eukprot:CAMPEP_0206580104 /NCGR_PEP_ID=MMETSP0325_2-20121206/32949_1 /ASSEMBLY_ACC=CAM_ASM_000347 /TAXON_ID=2866 /ORGANISM="Crypthecodinium cohnii, Strain Seligo" /LENGTH=374 /DNA_ID=CAMNT_0054086049 /DNA_START=102 /DNA_END=1226 /DNA_ORIENTATION=-